MSHWFLRPGRACGCRVHDKSLDCQGPPWPPVLVASPGKIWQKNAKIIHIIHAIPRILAARIVCPWAAIHSGSTGHSAAARRLCTPQYSHWTLSSQSSRRGSLGTCTLQYHTDAVDYLYSINTHVNIVQHPTDVIHSIIAYVQYIYIYIYHIYI